MKIRQPVPYEAYSLIDKQYPITFMTILLHFLEVADVNRRLHTNHGKEDEKDFFDVQYCEVDDFYASTDEPAPSHTHLEPIGTE